MTPQEQYALELKRYEAICWMESHRIERVDREAHVAARFSQVDRVEAAYNRMVEQEGAQS